MKPLRLLIRRTLLALLCILVTSGCAEGWKASEDEAREWLPGAIPRLQKVIVLLRTCQPRRSGGYNIIWADGTNGGAEPAHCSFGNDDGLKEIQSLLQQAGLLGVNYWPSGSPTKPVNWADFIMFREGMVTSGSTTSVIYKAQPEPCQTTTEGDQNFRIVRRPIGTAPCRWFWERSEG